MEVSRIFFTKETKDKMEQGLNIMQRGKLRWEKIKEADAKGTLAMAKNRYEVANLAGFTEDRRDNGYQWVSNMVGRGHLQEIVHGVGPNGKVEYEYHAVGEPDYNHSKARRAKQNKAENSVKMPTMMVVGEKKSPCQIGQERFEKLKAMEKSGRLSEIRSRNALANELGGRVAFSWLSSMITRGFIKETLSRYEQGYPLYEYTLTGKMPDYTYSQQRKPRKPSNTVATMVVEKTEPVVQVSKPKNEYVVEITRGDTAIKVSLASYDEVSELIKKILKGE